MLALLWKFLHDQIGGRWQRRKGEEARSTMLEFKLNLSGLKYLLWYGCFQYSRLFNVKIICELNIQSYAHKKIYVPKPEILVSSQFSCCVALENAHIPIFQQHLLFLSVKFLQHLKICFWMLPRVTQSAPS